MRIAIGADHGGYPLNERIIEELHIQKALLSCSGFSLERGMTEILFAEAQIKRKAIESSQQLFALVDSSKFGKEDMNPFARPMQIAHLFTDSGITDEWKSHLQSASIPVMICINDAVPV